MYNLGHSAKRLLVPIIIHCFVVYKKELECIILHLDGGEQLKINRNNSGHCYKSKSWLPCTTSEIMFCMKGRNFRVIELNVKVVVNWLVGV